MILERFIFLKVNEKYLIEQIGEHNRFSQLDTMKHFLNKENVFPHFINHATIMYA